MVLPTRPLIAVLEHWWLHAAASDLIEILKVLGPRKCVGGVGGHEIGVIHCIIELTYAQTI